MNPTRPWAKLSPADRIEAVRPLLDQANSIIAFRLGCKPHDIAPIAARLRREAETSPDPHSMVVATGAAANQAPMQTVQKGGAILSHHRSGRRFAGTSRVESEQQDVSAAQDRNEPVVASGTTVILPPPLPWSRPCAA